MKTVVNAVSAVLEDVRTYERRSRPSNSEADAETIHAMRERVEATLSNLVAATKTHAQSSGMSPVSLLDAAASHVSASVTDLGKTVYMRRATKAEQEQFAYVAASSSGGFAPSLRSVDESSSSFRGSPHQRGMSDARNTPPPATSGSGFGGNRGSASASKTSMSASASRPFSNRSSGERDRFRQGASDSSSGNSSPPPIFDQAPSRHATGVTSDDSAMNEGSEDAWTELKVSYS